MTRSVSLFALSLALATVLTACGRSESVDTFKPDRAEEKVSVTDVKGAAPKVDTQAKGETALGALVPQDECARDAAFVAYRKQLAAAVTAKDFDKLKPLLSPQIKLDFGGGSGLELMAERLAKGVDANLDNRPHWEELAEILTLGCALGSGNANATMPYAFEKLEGRDAFATLLPRRDGIALYKSEDANSEIAKTLHWEALTLANPNDASDATIAVKLDDGTTGFVRRADVRPATGYRALFNKGDDGKWLMTAFIAGD